MHCRTIVISDRPTAMVVAGAVLAWSLVGCLGNPPQIITQPMDVTVGAAQPATFRVEAAGAEPLSYQWFRDGRPIEGATGNTYTFAGTQSKTLEWDANTEPDVAGYILYQREEGTSYSPALIVTNNTYGTVTGLVSGIDYYFVATAFDRDGLESDYSNMVTHSDHGARFNAAVSNAAGAVTSRVATLEINLATPRATDGLVVLYAFNEGTGTTIRDVSGVGKPMDLTILDPSRVRWLGGGTNGVLFLKPGSAARTPGAADKLRGALTASGRMSLEVWLAPNSLNQSGPARVATLSAGIGSHQMNLHLGQGGASGLGDACSFRLRTSANSFSWLHAPGVFASTANLRHVVLTYDGSLQRLYIDGVKHGTMLALTGNFSNWNPNYPFVLGNESTLDRSWLGTLRLVAVYDRALSPAEVQQNFNAGPRLTNTQAQPPFIATHPSNVTVTESNSATFDVAAGGNGPLTYQWRRSGANIAGATSRGYTLNSTSIASDNGARFDVVVSNPSGSATSMVGTLTVQAPSDRVSSGLVVLYEFNEGKGDTVQDVGGVGMPMNLSILDSARIQWLPGGGLRFNYPGSAVRSLGPATKIHSALTASSRLTLEAWATPASVNQFGPARVVTLSGGIASSQMDFHLGQGGASGLGEAGSFRLRTTSSSFSWLQADKLFDNTADPRHIVLTYDGTAQRVYADGVARSTPLGLTGNFSNWDTSYALVLGNEASLDRSWLGSIYLLAVYDRALTLAEVEQNFAAGPTRPGAGGGSSSPGNPLELRVILTQSELLLLWPSEEPAAILQEAAEVGEETNWADVPARVAVDGKLNVVRMPAWSGQRFFRLRQPGSSTD